MRKLLIGTLILLLTVALVGCLSSQEPEEGKLIVKQIKLKSGRTVQQGTIQVNGKQAAVGKEISLPAGTHLIKAKTKLQGKVYEGQKKVTIEAGTTIIRRSLPAELSENKTASRDNIQLTVDYEQPVVKGKKINFSGTASDPIYKIIASVDGWKIKETKVQADHYQFEYSFSRAQTGRKLVINAFNSAGQSVEQIEKEIDVYSSALTINCPEQIKAGSELEITGSIPAETEKVVVTMDGWKIGKKKVEGGKYKLNTTINQAGTDRKLVVKAFASSGTSLAQESRRIDVVPDRVKLDVPYYYQLNNAHEPLSSCNITSVAMAVSYQQNRHLDPDTIYNQFGTVFTGHKMANIARHYGCENSTYHAGVEKEKIKDYLDRGIPVIFQGQFTSGDGHIVLIVGYDDTGWFVNDPYGEYYSWGYQNNPTAGDGVHYSYQLIDNNSIGGANNYHITAVY